MNTIQRTIKFALIMIVLFVLGAPGYAQEDTIEVLFGWGGCPAVDEDGQDRAPAVRYEVYLQSGGAEVVKVAEVENDTTYTLAAERGVVQRIYVIGYDAAGRPSSPSEWSDPIYYEVERSADGPPPAQATLRRNYPNPFNPETTIVYGIPEDTPDGTRMALEIFNVRGERIRSFEVDQAPGWHEVSWDGKDDGGRTQATGTYVTRYICGDRVEVGKMTMVK